MSEEWTPVFVLPNIPLKTEVGCELVTIAPAHDPRVVALKRAHPSFRRFLKRFADNFGEKFEPAVMIVNSNAPDAIRDVAALASFRDLIAIATICLSRALELQHPRGHRIMFGEAFAIYPWMLDRHYRHMICSTPAVLGIHEIAKFRGQSSPFLSRIVLDKGDIDQPLFTVLLDRWRCRYTAKDPAWEDVALFRSLNMAYNASLLPAGTDTTFYDVGRVISLWVSAFEILVHPGGDGKVNRDKVFEFIERIPWTITKSGVLAYDTGNKTKIKRTLASWLYQMLYECRNDLLHGNSVDPDTLMVSGTQRTIFEFAAPLYRLALTGFLPLTYDRAIPSVNNPEAFGAYIADRMEFINPQEQAEKALLIAKQPIHDEGMGAI